MSALQGINMACDAVRTVTTTMDIVVNVSEAITEADISGLKMTAAVSKSAILALDILGIIGHHSGKISNNALSVIKEIETTVRIVDLPVHFSNEIKKLGDRILTAEGIIHLIEKGAIAPIAGLCKTTLQSAFFSEKHYLELVKKDSTAQRPVYGKDIFGETEIKGYRTIDANECEKNIALFDKIATGLNVTEAIANSSSIEGVYRTLISRTMQNLVRHDRPQPPSQDGEQPQVAPVVIQHNEPQNQVDINNLFKFKNMNSIPLELHTDRILKKYICPITQCPIRHIVQDPGTINAANPTFYEKEAIERWLETHDTSPATRDFLFKDDLILRPDIQREIDQRLEFHEREVKVFINHLVQQ